MWSRFLATVAGLGLGGSYLSLVPLLVPVSPCTCHCHNSFEPIEIVARPCPTSSTSSVLAAEFCWVSIVLGFGAGVASTTILGLIVRYIFGGERSPIPARPRSQALKVGASSAARVLEPPPAEVAPFVPRTGPLTPLRLRHGRSSGAGSSGAGPS